ncbi:MAG: polyphosphate kinase 1 [Bulleidia sp.]
MKTETVYENRELSWLKFNERVLEEAENSNLPLCERLSFVSIYQSNLDEFFMVRVGSLVDQMMLDDSICDTKTGMTPKLQLKAIMQEVSRLNRRKDAVYAELMKQLKGHGFTLLHFADMNEEQKEQASMYFDTQIAPLLSPLVVSRRQPFPFLNNREIHAVAVLAGRNGKERIGIVPCRSQVFPRLIPLDGGFVLCEDLILHYISRIFSGFRCVAKSLIRITRNADIDSDSMYDEDLDYRQFMETIIRKRKRLSPVRLQVSRNLDGDIIDLLCTYTGTDRSHVFPDGTPLSLDFLFTVQDILRNNTSLFFPKRSPQNPAWYDAGRPVFDQVHEKDRLLSYPFESIKPFLSLLEESAKDPDVVSIRMTLYRAAQHSKIIDALIDAAENGKDVLVLVELKARFDEENNILNSRRLEEAGCQVIYGLEGYKVHSKLCLITRRKHHHIEHISLIGTGNFNEKTARLYTDLALMTCDEQICTEVSNVFMSLCKGETVKECHDLLVAPECLQSSILAMIQDEITHAQNNEPAYIGVKINSLTDKAIIDALMEASQAGVHIDMVVRGICCMKADYPGFTDNVRIISIVGRFLEHSRIYIFGSGTGKKVFISSADFMTRNTLHRVEAAVRIKDPDIRNRITDMFETMLKDNVQAREMNRQGIYEYVRNNEEACNSQEIFYEQAYAAAASTKPPVRPNHLFPRFHFPFGKKGS